mmetsp:Transcript_59311/g.122701  ORF Transcript_59311/g.122701 Transcript_59311/m.122701 type:complete len:240 (-) Transcript_59311:22-741(-)
MDADSARRQSAEIEALQAIYAEDGEFELLQEPEEGEAAGASFRVRCPNFLGEVRVNLPATYPAQGRPTFVLERLRGPAAEAVQLGLEELANEHAAEECIFDVLSRAVEVAESAGLALPDEAPVAAAQSIPLEEAVWATEFADGTMLRLSVRSGPKVKHSQITNKSELRRVAHADSVCVDLAPSRNTENYELAALLSNSLQVKAEDVEFVAGGRKEKASGDRTARIRGIAKQDLMDRLLS